jgi:putative membrane protein
MSADPAFAMTNTTPTEHAEQAPSAEPAVNLPALALRGGVGGVLMGLANLVPGISGGTMLLAAGVYPRFIEAIGEVTTLKFRRVSVVVLASVVLAAIAAIVLMAGTVKTLVVDHRWVMYAIFIGLTLGGVPAVWRLIKHPMSDELPEHDPKKTGNTGTASVWIGAAAGFAGMAALAIFQSSGAAGDAQRDGFVFLLLAGIAGASAMILPGVSGGYLLLVLGVYVPILAGVDLFKEGLKTRDTDIILDVGLSVVLPVGLGVLVGVVGVSNLLRWLLHRYEKATLGTLLGLLVGAVVGLWPFQQTIEPQEGQLVKGQAITLAEPSETEGVNAEPAWVYEDTGEPVEPEDLPTAFFSPTAGQVAGALGLIALGLGTTLLIDRQQGKKQ